MAGLVLSLFPGIGMLDMAFEEAGFCVARGPDLLWGGDVHRFHPPPGRFDGVIGGPPCQRFSSLAHFVRHVHGEDAVAPNLIPEFERIVGEAQPDWFLMENVPAAPDPEIGGYYSARAFVKDHWCGGETMRERKFVFGRTSAFRQFQVETLALHRTDPEKAALASGGGGGGVYHNRVKKVGNRAMSNSGYKTRTVFADHLRLQGLPPDFDLPGMTVAAKIKAVGNGVPLAMGRAVAAAVVRATAAECADA